VDLKPIQQQIGGLAQYMLRLNAAMPRIAREHLALTGQELDTEAFISGIEADLTANKTANLDPVKRWESEYKIPEKRTEKQNADIDAQKQEIEAKRGRVEDMKGSLAEMYRRFGNMDKAMDAAHLLTLQQIDAEQRSFAAGTKSEQKLATSDLMSADIARQAAERNERFYRYSPASSGSSAATPAQINALAAKLVTHCEHGRPRDEHCQWCHIQTAEYRQALVDGMWTLLD
jgi:predicted  nucleic acid-binding Zn-ribbon protein